MTAGLVQSETKTCTTCYVTKLKSEFPRDKKFKDGFRYQCKKCRNKTRVDTQLKIDNRNASSRAWTRHKYATDPDFKLACVLRARLRGAIKNNYKKSSAIELLGCTIDELKEHLSAKFTEGMSFENHGLWHIDHIMPCDAFDLTDPEQQKECFHFTNLQPLWAKDNLSKGAKIPDE